MTSPSKDTVRVVHTPTPWVMDEVRTQVGRAFRIGTGEMLTAGKGCCIIYDDYGAGETQRKANAAFIVRAVNAHDDLVKALEDIANMDTACSDTDSDAMHRMMNVASSALSRIKTEG